MLKRRKKFKPNTLDNSEKSQKGPLVTYVTKSSSIKGDIDSPHDIRIAGKIEGTVFSEKKIFVTESGHIKGSLKAPEADIAGKVEGDIKVDKSLALRSNARINGEVVSKKINIDEGAEIEGTLQVGPSNKSLTEVKPKQVSSRISLKK